MTVAEMTPIQLYGLVILGGFMTLAPVFFHRWWKESPKGALEAGQLMIAAAFGYGIPVYFGLTALWTEVHWLQP